MSALVDCHNHPQFNPQTDALSTAQSPESPALLTSWPVIQTTDREALATGLWNHYGARLIGAEPSDRPFQTIANKAKIGDLCLHYCLYSVPVDIQFFDIVGIRQLIPLSGWGEISSGGRKVQINPEVTTIIPAEGSFQTSYKGNYRQIVLQFDEAALHRKAEAILGARLTPTLNFPLLEPVQTASSLRSVEIARALGRILTTQTIVDLPCVEMSQALCTSFLFDNLAEFRNRMAQEPKGASISQVKVLEDYIQANWNKPLTAEDISAACGVSVRSVFAHFKQHRGIAPVTYLRELRLDRAHQRLLSQGEDSVISIAMACGFSSFGHFARRYRERFGELPSTTRARRSQTW